MFKFQVLKLVAKWFSWYSNMKLIWCVCLPYKTMAKTMACMVNYHIQPSFRQWACSILGHGSCSGAVLLCQVLDKRDTAFWSGGVQEEWFPCDLKEQVVGKHLHGFFQMAFSNKTPEERTKWLFLRSLPFLNLVQYVQNYLHKLRQYWNIFSNFGVIFSNFWKSEGGSTSFSVDFC